MIVYYYVSRITNCYCFNEQRIKQPKKKNKNRKKSHASRFVLNVQQKKLRNKFKMNQIFEEENTSR